RAALGDVEWTKAAVALNTVFRQSNQFQLRWTDVNFDTGTITVRRSKSGEAYHVPMNDDVRAVLRDLPSRLRSEWVFPSDTGHTPLDAKNYMHRVLNPALKRAPRRFPMARPPTHLRQPTRDGGRGYQDRAGADGAQDAGDDPALHSPVARPSLGRGTTFDATANRHHYWH